MWLAPAKLRGGSVLAGSSPLSNSVCAEDVLFFLFSFDLTPHVAMCNAAWVVSTGVHPSLRFTEGRWPSAVTRSGERDVP